MAANNDNRTPTNIRIDPELLAAMRGIRDDEGIPVSVQIRKGIELWLARKGAKGKKRTRK
jgi:hypothetical protein